MELTDVKLYSNEFLVTSVSENGILSQMLNINDKVRLIKTPFSTSISVEINGQLNDTVINGRDLHVLRNGLQLKHGNKVVNSSKNIIYTSNKQEICDFYDNEWIKTQDMTNEFTLQLLGSSRNPILQMTNMIPRYAGQYILGKLYKNCQINEVTND